MQRWLQQQAEWENVHAMILSPVNSVSNRTRSAAFDRRKGRGEEEKGWGWGTRLAR